MYSMGYISLDDRTTTRRPGVKPVLNGRTKPCTAGIKTGLDDITTSC